jgi:DNA-binding transcriptional LysR family regulator
MNLWERLITNLIPWIREQEPEAILDLETDYSDLMMNHLSEGLLDIGVMYTPAKVQGLKIEKLLEEDLIMVSTHAQKLSEVEYTSYVMVKWGRAFLHMHRQAFAELSSPLTSVGLGPVALRHILDRGGSCYQALDNVGALIDKRELFIVKDAPVYPRPVYIVYSDDVGEISRLQLALDGLRHVAQKK